MWLFFMWLVSFFGQVALALVFAFKVGKCAQENGITPEYLREHDISDSQHSFSVLSWVSLLCPIVNTFSLFVMMCTFSSKLRTVEKLIPALKEMFESHVGE